MINASPFVKTNIVGTLVLLEAIRCNKIDRFIQISTDEVYGSAPDKKKFSEESSLNASSPYSASKASADLICNSYFKSYNVPVIITRSSNNYGPYQFPEKLIPLMIKNAFDGSELPVYGNGLHVRNWLYVEDNCEAIDLVIKNGEIGEIYNIGGDSEKTNIEVVKLICKFLADETGKNEKYFEELITFIKDPRGNAHDLRYALDCNKIKKNLGWTPKTNFHEGLRKTIKWYTNNKDWVKSVTSGEYKEYYNKVYGKRNK
jgi:dTDP-glucose 4,6-dehydratase